jgi:pimeloyl-ACP methyl ester carboxylesterase
MTAAARFQTRSTGSLTHLAHQGRRIAWAHPYAVAAVATAGALATLALVNRRLARNAENDRVPGAGHMIHQTATGVVMSAIDEVATARSASG